MLRVSKLADYGTAVMVHLARHSEAIMNAKEIAKNTHLAAPTVSKLLKLLASASLLISQRGTKGGYRLAEPASAISVGQIIQAIEGQSGLTQCSYEEGECALEDVCVIRGNWRLINQAVYTALCSVSLAVFAKPSMAVASVDISQIQRINNEVSKEY